MNDKSGAAVKLSMTNELFLSANVYDPFLFLLVRCRAWTQVNETLRPQCYSMVDASRTSWYIRHFGFYLRREPADHATNPQQFDVDSSFVLHADTLYGGYYALESVNYPGRYWQPDHDGYLVIRPVTVDYHDKASFLISKYNETGT